jgi:hypothetical protein
MDTYTEPQKLDIISQGMQRIEDTLRDAVECAEAESLALKLVEDDDGDCLWIIPHLKEALTICELMNPNNNKTEVLNKAWRIRQ